MKPLEYLSDLINWNSPINKTEYCHISYTKRKLQTYSGLPIEESVELRPNKVLLCHDMSGGYLDDAEIKGNDNIYAYRFYHWHLIDIFVYFSHHFITIPPTGWIVQAHKNDVQCLGTLIIEPGDHVDNFLKLFDSDNIELVAEKLDDIRKFYNFDGWLINLECSVEASLAPRIVSNICTFLDYLSNAGNEVIWYDAITVTGSLSWQNCLNENNRIFYDHCGKIFTNYGWTDEHLRTSLKMCNKNGDTVFVGLDCFGRGCPGGGGFNCKSALEMIVQASTDSHVQHNSKLSIALFAPGWCYQQISTSEQEQKLDLNVWRFYHNMEQYLHPCLDNNTVYRQLPEIFIGGNTSFHTSFDIGQGMSRKEEGIIKDDKPYNNLMHQEVTPSGSFHQEDEGVYIKFIPCRKISYSGYSCSKMIVHAAKQCSNITMPITVELFRLGCHIQHGSDATLNLWLGQTTNHLNDKIWSGLLIKLSFSIDSSRIQVLEYELGDTIQPSLIAGNIVQWRHFQINKLCSRLEESSDNIALRKVEIVIRKEETLHDLESSSIYFGWFDIDSS